MSCEKHKRLPENYTGGTIRDLAIEICDMHYESLQELMEEIAKKLEEDANKDKEKQRMKLHLQLNMASIYMKSVANKIGEAWRISKPFIK